jgi:hypothetical protein
MNNRSKQTGYEFKNRYLRLKGGGIEEEYRSIIKRGAGIEEEHMKAYQTAMTLICPITQELMLDPVTICTGRTFERSAIEAHFRCSGGNRDPSTNEPLSNRRITPSILVQTLTKQFVDFYKGKQGEEWERVVQYCNTYKTTLREEREREREREREQESERQRIRIAKANSRPTTMTFDPSSSRIINSMNNQLAQAEARRAAARREELPRDETDAASRLVEYESRINAERERQANGDLLSILERLYLQE